MDFQEVFSGERCGPWAFCYYLKKLHFVQAGCIVSDTQFKRAEEPRQ